MPQLTPGMPQLTPGMPQLTQGMPQLTPGMPQPPPGMPQPTPGMPQPTPVMPQPTLGMPQPTPGIPQPTPGMPQVGGASKNTNSKLNSISQKNINSELDFMDNSNSENTTTKKSQKNNSIKNTIANTSEKTSENTSENTIANTSENAAVKANSLSIKNDNEKIIEKNQIDMNKLSKTPSLMENSLLSRFLEFVKTYSKIAKFDTKKLDSYNMTELTTSAFKTFSNYDPKDPVTGNLFISDENMDKFCVENAVDDVININLNDSKFDELVKIYSDMKTKYLGNCEKLLSILENYILTKVGSESSMRFTLKNIGYAELVEQETNVRNNISTMYAECHQNYQTGIVSLYNALTTVQEV